MELSPLRELIRRRSGLELGEHGAALLADSVAARQGATGLGDAQAYYLRLLADPEELDRLVELVAINETYFLRDEEQLEFLVDRLLPRLLADRAGEGGETAAVGGQTGRVEEAGGAEARLGGEAGGAGARRPASTCPLRILSAGCSSGEEVYSLAILLHERYGESAPRLFSLLGIDLDREALERARAGLYRPFSFRGVGEERRRRWFSPAPGGLLRLDPRLAAMAEFRRMNLLGDDWPGELGFFDVILLRNVSIYFDEGRRREIQGRLGAILGQRGILLIGSAEILANDLGILELRAADGQFYFARRGEGRIAPGPATSASAPPLGSAAPARAAGPVTAGAAALATAPARSRAARSAPGARESAAGGQLAAAAAVPSVASVHPVAAVVETADRGPPPSLAELRGLARERRYAELLEATRGRSLGAAELLLRAYALLEGRACAEAEVLAREVLVLDPWSADALLLLGLAARHEGRREEAIERFREAAYAEKGCWIAHFHLAELLRQLGREEAARREYRIVLRALEGGGGPEGGLALLPLGLPLADLRELCARRLGSREA